MDMAGLSPKYINIVRGSYIMACIGIAVQYVLSNPRTPVK